jgi:hypothetical protein
MFRWVSPFSQTTKALRESRGIALLCFQTSALERREGLASRPGRSLPPGKTRYPLYRRLDGPQGRSGQVRKISPPTGIFLCTSSLLFHVPLTIACMSFICNNYNRLKPILIVVNIGFDPRTVKHVASRYTD